MTGKVVDVPKAEQALEVRVVRAEGNALRSGEKISFRVSDKDYKIGYLNRGIRGNAVRNGGLWHLGQIFPVSGPDVSAMRATNQAFIDHVEALPPAKFLKVGDSVPDFAMFDQDGNVFRISQLRGSAYVINFIFTRCGVPNMCPASSQKMSEMQEKAREMQLEDLHFVTVSFDPAFDSPSILRGYGEAYGMEFENFRFLTASQEVVDRLLRLFGLLTIEEDGTINHTMTTLLIDAQGDVASRQEGPNWDAQVFLDVAGRF